jgi:16S rRNA (uracil1498-N3)-methyltransferase
MNPIFYAPPQTVHEDALIIKGEEARHIIKVMRLKKGDIIEAVDGIGGHHRCSIEKIDEGRVVCRIYASTSGYGETWHQATLAAGLSAGIKFDEVVQRCTELGVSRIIPLISEKSKAKIESDAAQKKKIERWRKVAIASIKQSRRSVIPEIGPIIPFEELFEKYINPETAFLFDPEGERGRLKEMSFDLKKREYGVIVGPESGFSRAEIKWAADKGITAISLGKRILRAENAAPTAVALIMYLLDEFR